MRFVEERGIFCGWEEFCRVESANGGFLMDEIFGGFCCEGLKETTCFLLGVFC